MWEDASPAWCKVHRGWWFSPSHMALDIVTKGVGLFCLWMANHYGRRPDGSGAVLGPDRKPLDLEQISRQCGATKAQAKSAIQRLTSVGTVVAENGVVVFPKLRRWQEDPAAERMRRYRERAVTVTGTVTQEVADGVTARVAAPLQSEARSQKPEDQRSEEDAHHHEPGGENMVPPTPRDRCPAEAGRVDSGEDLGPLLQASIDLARGASGPVVLEQRKPRVEASDVDAVLDRYREHHPKARPGEKERKLVRARLGEGYSVEELRRAIDGNTASPFHSGENEGGANYQRLSLIFRDSDHVANFLALADQHCDAEGRRRAAPVLTMRTRQNIRAMEAFIAGEDDIFAES